MVRLLAAMRFARRNCGNLGSEVGATAVPARLLKPEVSNSVRFAVEVTCEFLCGMAAIRIEALAAALLTAAVALEKTSITSSYSL